MWQSCYRLHLQVTPCNTSNGVESLNSHLKNVDDLNGGHIKMYQVTKPIYSLGQSLLNTIVR